MFSRTSSYITYEKRFFHNCYYPNLKYVELPRTLTSIGDGAFAGATELQDVDILTVKDLGTGIFENCASLQSAVLNNTLKSIPAYMATAVASVSCIFG